MTRPTEAQLVEMEQRARWLLDGIEIQRMELERQEIASQEGPRSKRGPTRADYQAVDTREAIARDVLVLVSLVRQSEGGGGGVSRAGLVEKPSPTLL
jgi:hypothetical protein